MTSAIPVSSSAQTTRSSTVDAGNLPTILVIDDSPTCRDTVCKVLRDNGFAVLTASDGELGLAQLSEHPCVLVLLDNDMPKMNGLAFLKALRSKACWANLPVVMLTTSNAKAVIVEALRYKIAGYVLKERLAMPALIERVRSAIKQSPQSKPGGPQKAPAAAIAIPHLVTRDLTLNGVVSGDGIRTLTGVVKQVTAIAQSPKASVGEIAAIVRQDPVLACRIIQLATSSAYAGSKSRLASIDDAIRIVGIPAVRDLAASFGVFTAFPEDGADGLDLIRCWQHSFAVASVMARLVPKSDDIAPGLPYVVGLCHDLGEIFLRQKFPREYAAAQDFALQSSVTTLSLLPAVFGVSYAELMQTLMDRLKFPPKISEPINELYKPHLGWSIDSYKGLLARTLSIANMMTHGMLLTASTDNPVSPVLQSDCRNSLIPSAMLNVAEIQSESVTAVLMLADVPTDQMDALSRPLFARRDTTVLYVRHSALAHLDPLEVALRNLAKVELSEKVPNPAELAMFDGIVALAPNPLDTMLSLATRQHALMAEPIPLLKLVAAAETQAPAPAAVNDGATRYPLPIKDLAKFVSTLRVRA